MVFAGQLGDFGIVLTGPCIQAGLVAFARLHANLGFRLKVEKSEHGLEIEVLAVKVRSDYATSISAAQLFRDRARVVKPMEGVESLRGRQEIFSVQMRKLVRKLNFAQPGVLGGVGRVALSMLKWSGRGWSSGRLLGGPRHAGRGQGGSLNQLGTRMADAGFAKYRTARD